MFLAFKLTYYIILKTTKMKRIIFLFLLFLAFGCQIFSQSNGHLYLKGDIMIRSLAESSAEFNVAVETFNTSCGLNNGQLKVYIEGGKPPYVVLVDGVPLASPWELKNLSPGFRRVDVSDQAGNKYALYKAQIDPSTNPVLSLDSKKDDECGKGDGWIQMKGTSGVTPYSFKLTNGQESFTGRFENLKKENYQITLTDGHGCTDVKSVSIKASGAPRLVRMDSLICGPESKFDTKDTITTQNSGCDSVTIVSYKSGYDTMSIKKMSCSLDTTLPIVIHRVNKCDSIVLVTYFPAPGPFVDIVEKVSCVKTGFDTIHHYFNGLPCLRDSFLEVIKYLPIKVDTVTTSLKTCDQNSAQSLFTEKVQKNADSCVVKVFMKEVLYYGITMTTDTTFIELCNPKGGKSTQRDTIFKSIYGCDSAKVTTITRFHKPFYQTLPFIRVEFPNEARIDTLLNEQTFWGCDSIITRKYVYTPVLDVPLSDTTVCSNRTPGDTLLVKKEKYTGYNFDSAIITQKVIFLEKPTLHPDRKKDLDYIDGEIDLSVSGGKAPYDLRDENGIEIPFERSGLLGGVYLSVVEDANGCKDSLLVALAEISVHPNGNSIILRKKGFQQELIDHYGASIGNVMVVKTCGEILETRKVDFINENDIEFKKVPEKEFGSLVIVFPKGKLRKKFVKF